ncbi:MAG: hypothetical protein V3T05_05565, partial [Myxococcota bacterium]
MVGEHRPDCAPVAAPSHDVRCRTAEVDADLSRRTANFIDVAALDVWGSRKTPNACGRQHETQTPIQSLSASHWFLRQSNHFHRTTKHECPATSTGRPGTVQNHVVLLDLLPEDLDLAQELERR